MLRTLAGGAYLDLYLWMNISPDYCIEISRYVMKNQICRDAVIDTNFCKNTISNKQEMLKIRQNFVEKSYYSLFWDDGWLVRITCQIQENIPA